MKFKNCSVFLFVFPLFVFAGPVVFAASTSTDSFNGDLHLGAYCTAGTARTLLDPKGRTRALATLERFGMTRIIIETNRGGSALSETEMRTLRDFFTGKGYDVTAGMATVPGGDWGVPADEGLAWLNYQSPKTQADIERAVRAAARVFDTLVIDDFLCSGDMSPESDFARRGREWGAYRRDLLTSLSQRMIIGPAREENPDVRVVIKIPQSYDRYHTFGYDVAREPQLFDEVWVGTETRGQYTQRFGFTQPYEGFVNFRWIESLARGKMASAWFDHGDCDGPDFVEQAWQTVLAGANEIVLFNFANLSSPHPGHGLLLADLARLRKLARAVAAHPVTGVAAYKPANSDPGGDMYVMDFVGMLGVPLVPVSTFPVAAEAVFLPTQAAKDADVVSKIEDALAAGHRVTITGGLLGAVADNKRLAKLAGLKAVPEANHQRLNAVWLNEAQVTVPRGLDVACVPAPGSAEVLLWAESAAGAVPFLTTNKVGSGMLFVLNVHTFLQADFDAVGEVLLSPRNLGLLDIPQTWANTLRGAMGGGGDVLTDAPTRVTFQPLGKTGWFIQNYNKTPLLITLGGGDAHLGNLHDGFTGEPLVAKGNVLQLTLPPRSRQWVAR